MTSASVYQLYQMKDTAENQPFLFQSLDTILARGGNICADRYELVYESVLAEDMTASSVKQELESKPRSVFKHHSPTISDVLVLRRAEETLCHFLDRLGMAQIHGFFAASDSSSGTALTPDATGYTIRGKPGLWSVVDAIAIEQSMFFLLENEKYGRRVNRMVLNAAGEIVMDDNQNDFDDATVQRIRQFLHPEPPSISPTPAQKPALERYQRYYENGEYERTASFENHEEQNYNMIDGNFNNHRSKQRPSVRQRLKEKLALVQSRKHQEEERIK